MIEPLFGHLLHRVFRPFAPEAAVLDAAERHHVDAAARRLVDVDDADVKPPGGRIARSMSLREDAGGKTERARHSPRDRVVERTERDHRDDRREDLFAA